MSRFSDLIKAAPIAVALTGLSVNAWLPTAVARQDPDHERRFVAVLHAMPEQQLKDFYLRCSQAALEGSLGSGEVALCSVGYEVLLQRSFGGDFLALLAWSRSQPSTAATASVPAESSD